MAGFDFTRHSGCAFGLGATFPRYHVGEEDVPAIAQAGADVRARAREVLPLAAQDRSDASGTTEAQQDR